MAANEPSAPRDQYRHSPSDESHFYDRLCGDVLRSHFAGKTGGSVASLMDADPDDAVAVGRINAPEIKI